MPRRRLYLAILFALGLGWAQFRESGDRGLAAHLELKIEPRMPARVYLFKDGRPFRLSPVQSILGRRRRTTTDDASRTGPPGVPELVSLKNAKKRLEAPVIAGLNTGQTYANIHDPTFPGGEIRGQLALQAVPEPATGAFLLIGSIAGLARLRHRSYSV